MGVALLLVQLAAAGTALAHSETDGATASDIRLRACDASAMAVGDWDPPDPPDPRLACPELDPNLEIGSSTECSVVTQCVVGSGWSESAGTSLTSGYALGLCKGAAEAAILVEISCSMGTAYSATSFAGTAGSSELMVVPTNSVDRMSICWTVTGHFETGLYGVVVRSTSGCGLLGV